MICAKIMKAGNLARHLKIHEETATYQTILEDMKSNQKKIELGIEDGEIIKKIMQKENIYETSLGKEHSQAIKLLNNIVPKFNTPLRKWQQELLEKLVPSERDIIWVVGKAGNEGKSWFQKYLESYFGMNRTFNAPINKQSGGLLHTLSKRTYSLIDVFIFNIPRGFDIMDISYTFIEEIKDGNAFSSKYDSKCLTLKTPNIILIFANKPANLCNMSKDRWRMFDIVDDDLIEKNLRNYSWS